MSHKKLVAAGFIIYREWGKQIQYLLLQTSYGEHHWTPPKGHVDPGESEMETAVRETEEESGLKLSSLCLDEEFKSELFYEVQGKPKKVVYWLAKLRDPNDEIVLSDEHIDYKWLDLLQACEYAKYKEMQDALNQADSFIRS